MYQNHEFNDASEALPPMLSELLHMSDEVGSRAGRTKELTHVGITLAHPWRRELLVEYRKPSLAAQIAETAWVLAGRDDISWLVKYLPRAVDFSDDGQTWRAAYGARLRRWPQRNGLTADVVDQLRWVVDLLRRDHGSRQAVMSIWDPVVDTTPGKDIPCNDWLHFLSRLGKLDLHVAVRSNDIIWGWSGINQFEWSALQEVVAGLLGLEVGGLHFSITSLHLYDRHRAKAKKIVDQSWATQTPTRPEDSPRFDASVVRRDLDEFDALLTDWFEVEKAIRHGEDADRAVDLFPEPMLQSWLRVLQWWWTHDRDYLHPIKGTALEVATHFSVQPDQEDIRNGFGGVEVPLQQSEFLQYVIALHNQKHAAYGDSWKRRGEMLSIMANIARKIDRLGQGQTSDETQADTAMDLFVYLAKYRAWLEDEGIDPQLITGYAEGTLSDTAEYPNEIMGRVERELLYQPHPEYSRDHAVKRLENELRNDFDGLAVLVQNKNINRYSLVDRMLRDAYRLAYERWDTAQDEYRGADAD